MKPLFPDFPASYILLTNGHMVGWVDHFIVYVYLEQRQQMLLSTLEVSGFHRQHTNHKLPHSKTHTIGNSSRLWVVPTAKYCLSPNEVMISADHLALLAARPHMDGLPPPSQTSFLFTQMGICLAIQQYSVDYNPLPWLPW